MGMLFLGKCLFEKFLDFFSGLTTGQGETTGDEFFCESKISVDFRLNEESSSFF
jgi:hypothetical protein